MIGASVNQMPTSQSPRPFCFHITRFPPCFARKFFRAPHTRARMRWIGQIFWLLAYIPISIGITFFPPSPPKSFRGLALLGSRIQLQQRNCSRFARDFLRRSTFSSSQRTGSRSSGLRSALQELFNQPTNQHFLCHRLALV